jgi:5-deoxy-glucuronate isomerase
MITKYKVSEKSGHQTIFQVGKDNIAWLGFEILRLEANENWQTQLKDEECALVPMGGRVSVLVNSDGKSSQWTGVGGRQDIFSGSPHVVYAPRHSSLKLTAETRLELALVKTPCSQDLPPSLIKPEDVKVVSSGVANWRRDVRLVIAPGSTTSQRLIIGETINPPGNWSGIPPHKHDEITGKENFLEEFYWFKVKPTNSYGIHLGYKDQQEESYFVHNDEVFFMENGYHPTVAAPGTTICYLWVLAGENKAYNIVTDPRFDWVSNAEAVFKEIHR